MREAKAPPDDPTNVTVVLELKDTGQRVKVSKDHPFQRLDGYVADLRYEPEHRHWLNRRVGSVLALRGDEYHVVAITTNEVILLTRSDQKMWKVEYQGASESPSGPPGTNPVAPGR